MIELGSIPLKDESSIVEARNKIRTLAEDLRFSTTGATRLATITSELVRSILQEGEFPYIEVSFDQKDGEDGFRLLLAFQSKDGSLHIGRASNFFDELTTTRTDSGVQRMEASKVIPDRSFRPTEEFISAARERLMRLSRAGLLEEVNRKNEELRESEERLRRILDNVPDVIFRWSVTSGLDYVSPSVLNVTGYAPDELMGEDPMKGLKLAKSTYQDITEDFRKSVTGETTTSFEEFVFVRKDGSEGQLEIRSVPITDDDGNFVAFEGILRDVTERKKMEEALRESEQLSRGMLETAATGIYLLQDGRFQYVNRPFEEMSGYTRDELIDTYSLEYVHPDDRDEVRKKAIEVLKGRRSLPFEYRLLRKDSKSVWVLDWVTSIQYKGKRSVLGTLMNVTERKQAEEKIQRYTRRVEALHAVGQAVSQTSDMEELLDNALEKVIEITGTDSGTIYLLDVSEKALTLRSRWGLSAEVLEDISTIQLSEEELQSILGWKEPSTALSRTRKGPLSHLAAVIEKELIESFVAVPLNIRGNLQGILGIGSHTRRELSEDEMGLLRAIGNEVAVGVDNAMLLERTRELSITDEVTGLYNRRHLYGVLDTETYRSRRYGSPFSLAIIDLDGFKEYNDTFGHTAGDSALKAFGQTLSSSLRESDPAFRYGGDEFAVVLPTTDAERAKMIIDRIRTKWSDAGKTQSTTRQSPIGFSAGIAQFPENAETADGLVFLADTALFRSKREGGNRSTVVSELGTLTMDVLDTATLDQVYALSATVDARDPYTYGHSKRVATISELIGKAIDSPREELVNLHAAGLLHDIGKVGVPDAILTKPGKLEDHEWRIIKQHSSEGARIVERVKDLGPLVPLIRHHHEWYNGTGYPDGLKGEDIPLGARIISVGDAYDTMTTLRPYRTTVSHEEACKELNRCSGTQFDPELVEVFERVMTVHVRHTLGQQTEE